MWMLAVIQMKNQIWQADICGRRIEGNQKPPNAYLSQWVVYIDVSAGTPALFFAQDSAVQHLSSLFSMVLLKFHSFLITCELSFFEMIELNSIFLLPCHKHTILIFHLNSSTQRMQKPSSCLWSYFICLPLYYILLYF